MEGCSSGLAMIFLRGGQAATGSLNNQQALVIFLSNFFLIQLPTCNIWIYTFGSYIFTDLFNKGK